jgi:hypothetical protein
MVFEISNFASPPVPSNDNMIGSDNFRLVEYYSKACPHCTHLQPVWDAAKSAGVDGVKFVQKECYGDNWAPGKDIDSCKAHGIEAFPTMVLYKTQDLSDKGITVTSLLADKVKGRVNELLEFVKSQTDSASDVAQASVGFLTVLASVITNNRRTSENFF